MVSCLLLDPISEKISNSSAKFKKTVRNFRSGELNVLVATDVLEEGFDVPECSLIIRFVDFDDYGRS